MYLAFFKNKSTFIRYTLTIKIFHMTHSLKIFFAGIFTALVAISCLFILISSTTKVDVLKNIYTSVSTAISWNEALTLRNNYVENQPLMIDISENGGTRQVPLQGFTLQADQLQEIISNNKSGGNADAVMFYLGAENPLPGSTLPRYNLIAVGIKNGALMIPLSERDWDNPAKSSVFDKADPCPPFCPE
jgi:hypothetical protein